jgi:hypothetical protein
MTPDKLITLEKVILDGKTFISADPRMALCRQRKTTAYSDG